MIRLCVFIVAFLQALSPAFSDVTSVEITCQKSVYKPDIIRLKKGEPVVLIVRTADVTHGFAIDEFNIAKEIAPGRPVRIEFTPDRTGEFFYYCVVRCGKKHLQMRGKMIVE